MGDAEPDGSALADREALEQSLQRMASTLLSEESLDATMELVAELARASMRRADAVGVSMLRDGEIYTANYSDETARRIDAIQYDTHEGPCLTCLLEQRVVHLPSIEDEDRWPAFVAAATDAGISSILCLPLSAKTRVVGAINFYSRRSGFFDDRQRELAQAFADQASVLLANAGDYSQATRLTEHLREALRSRDVIGQAKGILMTIRKCGPEEAFALLTEASQRSNTKLRDVAQRVVDNLVAGRPPSDPIAPD